MEPFDHLNAHSHHVLALFPNLTAAGAAAEDIRSSGVPERLFSLLVREGDALPASSAVEEQVKDTAIGVSLGGAIGFVAGALAFGLPGVGTVIGAGLWATTAIGAAAGAAVGQELSDYHHAWEGSYQRAIGEGKVLVAISTDDALVAADAFTIFEAHLPLRLDTFDRKGVHLKGSSTD